MAAVVLAAAILFGIVGDSITDLSADELRAERAEVVAFGGVSILQARPALQEMAATRRVVVVAVGTMDVAYPVVTERKLRARVRAVFNDLRSVPCVIWVDLRYGGSAPGLNDRRVTMFNGLLRDISAQFGGHVAAWSTFSAGRNWFLPDGIHPWGVGQNAYARFLAGQVDRYCN